MKKLMLGLCILAVLLASCASAAPTAAVATLVDAKSFVKIIAAAKPCGTEAGYAVFAGKVTNTSATITFQAVELRGSIFDPAGKALNSNVALIDSDKIAPGQTASFKILVADPDGAANRFDSTCKVEFSNARVSQ